MGVRAVDGRRAVPAATERIDRIEPPRGVIDGDVEEREVLLHREPRQRRFHRPERPAARPGVAVDLLDPGRPIEPGRLRVGSLGFRPIAKARRVLGAGLADGLDPGDGTVDDPIRTASSKPTALRRAGSASISPGCRAWTKAGPGSCSRSIGFKYTTLHNADIRAGRLKERFDVLLIPSIEPKTLRDGYRRERDRAGLCRRPGRRGGRRAPRVPQGGRDARLPGRLDRLRHRGAGAARQERPEGAEDLGVLRPGSILRAVVTKCSSWTAGVPGELSVYFDRSQAFEFDERRGSRDGSVILSYAKETPGKRLAARTREDRRKGRAGRGHARWAAASSSSASAPSTAASPTARSGSCSMPCSGRLQGRHFRRKRPPARAIDRGRRGCPVARVRRRSGIL